LETGYELGIQLLEFLILASAGKKDLKMRTWPTISIIALWGVLNTLCPAIADELHLSNGDVITGRLTRMEENELFFKTTYAGDIKVNWSNVINLITDDPIEVILIDGTVFEGFSRKASVNMMHLSSEKFEASSDLRLSEVAEINPRKKPAAKITARIDVGLTQERGNTDTDNLQLNGEFIARTKKNRYTFMGELSKEKSKGKTTVENWLAYGNYSYFLTQKWFLYGQMLLEHDKFADLDLRSIPGAGAGYQFFESEALHLSAAVGPAWVDEDFIKAEDDDYSAGQWLINYDQYFFNKFVQLFHIQIGLISLSDSDKWLHKTRQGLRFPIYKGFTATIQYNYDYDNDPSPDADEKWDSKLMFLLGWKFGN
jgi:putative salt-induced outer membrane protein YdiY